MQIFVCKKAVKLNIFCVHKAVMLCRCSHFWKDGCKRSSAFLAHLGHFLFITWIRNLLLKSFSTGEVRVNDEMKAYDGQDKLRIILSKLICHSRWESHGWTTAVLFLHTAVGILLAALMIGCHSYNFLTDTVIIFCHVNNYSSTLQLCNCW